MMTSNSSNAFLPAPPAVCPTCHHCPTCGHIRVPPWHYTTTAPQPQWGNTLRSGADIQGAAITGIGNTWSTGTATATLTPLLK